MLWLYLLLGMAALVGLVAALLYRRGARVLDEQARDGTGTGEHVPRALTLYGTSSGIEAIEGQPATIGLDLARALYRAANEGDARAVLSLVAADRGHEEIVKALIARGADVKAADKEGHTAMWLATRRGRTNIEKILTEAGATG
jgi:hypothetical protein